MHQFSFKSRVDIIIAEIGLKLSQSNLLQKITKVELGTDNFKELREELNGKLHNYRAASKHE